MRRSAEADAERRELQHLAELEAAQEGCLAELDDGSLARRVAALEARRDRQEVELVALRWGVGWVGEVVGWVGDWWAGCAAGAAFIHSKILLDARCCRCQLEERQAQHERQLAEVAAAVEARQAAVAQQQQHSSEDVAARVLTASIFASVLAKADSPPLAARGGPAARLDLGSSGGSGSLRSGGCRITAAAAAGSRSGSPHSARRQLLGGSTAAAGAAAGAGGSGCIAGSGSASPAAAAAQEGEAAAAARLEAELEVVAAECARWVGGWVGALWCAAVL